MEMWPGRQWPPTTWRWPVVLSEIRFVTETARAPVSKSSWTNWILDEKRITGDSIIVNRPQCMDGFRPSNAFQRTSINIKAVEASMIHVNTTDRSSANVSNFSATPFRMTHVKPGNYQITSSAPLIGHPLDRKFNLIRPFKHALDSNCNSIYSIWVSIGLN